MKRIRTLLFFLYLPFFFLSILSFSPPFLFASTVTVVYDDSGSMLRHDKWIYANYAVQSLAALLGQDDHLFVVRMSRYHKIYSLDIQKNRQRSILEVQDTWKTINNTPTPYAAVTTAVDRAIRQSLMTQNVPGYPDNDWLVIMTDGSFENIPQNATIDFQRLLKQGQGKIRVVFLLIGNHAERKLPEAWNEVAPVDVFRASGPEDVTETMARIAALVTGRDRAGINVTVKDGAPDSLQFKTPFPLKRFLVFEQQKVGELAHMRKVSNRAVLLSSVQRNSVNLRTPGDLRGNRIAGRVTQVTAPQLLLPPGTYEMTFNRPVDLGKMQVLVDAAIDFTVNVLDSDGRIVKPENNNEFKLCRGKKATLQVRFYAPGAQAPLRLDAMARQLTVSGRLGRQKLVFNHAAHADDMRVGITVAGGSHPLSVEARYPGYFHLKSHILTLVGEECNKQVGIRSLNGGISMPIEYTWSKTMRKAGVAEIIFEGDGSGGVYTLTEQGIPAGFALRIDGKEMTREQPSIELTVTYGVAVNVEILRNRDFRNKDPFKMILIASTDKNTIEWVRDRTELLFKPTPRKISGVVGGLPWSAPVTGIKAAPPLTVKCLADGVPVTADEFRGWTVDWSADGLDAVINRGKAGPFFYLAPKSNSICDCLATTGRLPVSIRLRGPFPGEEATLSIVVSVEDVPWWAKCWIFVIALAVIVFLIAWAIGIWRKNRFAKGACIEYSAQRRSKKIRRQTYWLAGGWIGRWLVPYRHERATVCGITFVAGSRDGYIVLPLDQIKTDMELDALPIIDDKGRRPTSDKHFNINTTLVRLGPGNDEHHYTYKKT